MWPVSDQFQEAVAQPHTLATQVTVQLPGQRPTVLRLTAGTVTCDRTQRIRRTGQFTVVGDDTVFQALSTPGAVVACTHGLVWAGDDRELIPMIVGELSSAARQLGDGVIAVAVADLWQRVARSNYLVAYTPNPAAKRVDEISAAVRAAVPGTVVTNQSTDLGTVGVQQAWTSRADMIASFATDGGTEAFFAPDGSFVIRDQPAITDTPVWLFKGGTGGTITSLNRSRPLDQLFNTVIVQPASIDGSQPWTQVVAQITDPANPRRPAVIGVAPYVWTAPTILTVDEATRVASQILTRVQGTTETLQIEAVANPALEGGDVIRALSPEAGAAPIIHFIDGTTVDLVTGGQSVSTRSNTEVPA
jgi:hypothetical protein